VELTTMTLDRRGRLRRWLGDGGPPSLRGAVFLAVSTFLCGCVLASLLFVGIWRHTAGEAAQSKAAVAQTKAIQQSDHKQLLAVQNHLAALRTQLAHSRTVLAQAEQQAAGAKTALAHAQSASRELVRSLAPRLQTLSDAAASLARTTATIQSELGALATYAHDPGGAGLDAGYLESQTRYVARVAAAAAAAAAALAQDASDAQAAAHG
jgi:predicted  nucleic acid-binding Zn-ribbon protein